MCPQLALIIAIIVIGTIVIGIVVSNSWKCHDSYLVAPYFDLTAPGPQGSPYALESCMQ